PEDHRPDGGRPPVGSGRRGEVGCRRLGPATAGMIKTKLTAPREGVPRGAVSCRWGRQVAPKEERGASSSLGGGNGMNGGTPSSALHSCPCVAAGMYGCPSSCAMGRRRQSLQVTGWS